MYWLIFWDVYGWLVLGAVLVIMIVGLILCAYFTDKVRKEE